MNFNRALASVLLAWLSLQLSALAQVKTTKATVDDLINWSDPMAMTKQQWVGILDANTKDRSKPVYTVEQGQRSTNVSFKVLEDNKNCKLDGKLFNGAFKVQKVAAWYSLTNGVAYHYSIEFSKETLTKKKMALLEGLLAQKTGDAKPKQVQMSRSSPTNLQWRTPKYRVDLMVYAQTVTVDIDSLAPRGL